jgi:hypothetical protein
MNKTSRAIIFGFVMLMLFSAFTQSQAQTLYPSLGFERETDEDGTFYKLRPNIGEIHKRVGGPDKPFMILGVVALPQKERVVLLLVNAQPEFQFEPTDNAVVIKAGSSVIRDLSYTIAGKSKGDTSIKTEIANVLISLDDYRTIANADSVVASFGKVTYQLDKENQAALRFLLNEIDKDNK